MTKVSIATARASRISEESKYVVTIAKKILRLKKEISINSLKNTSQLAPKLKQLNQT